MAGPAPEIPPLDQIDLNATQIPRAGIEVEIEGVGTFIAQVSGNLITAVGHVYVMLTGEIFVSTEWTIELLELRNRPAYIKVAMARV